MHRPPLSTKRDTDDTHTHGGKGGKGGRGSTQDQRKNKTYGCTPEAKLSNLLRLVGEVMIALVEEGIETGPIRVVDVIVP